MDGTVQSDAGTGTPTDRRPRRTSTGPTSGQACETFVVEYNIITRGERNGRYVAGKELQIDTHLVPFFGKDRPVTESCQA